MPFTSETARAAGSKPKKRDFLTQQIISELNELRADQVTKARGLVIALIDKAMDGDIPAVKEVLDRVEGKVTQPLSGDEDQPLTINMILSGFGASIDSKLTRLISGRVEKLPTEPER